MSLLRIRTKYQRFRMAMCLAKQLKNHADPKVVLIAEMIEYVLGAPIELVNVKLYKPSIVAAEVAAASSEAQVG